MKWRNEEQWIALFPGVACIALFLWVLVDGEEAFSSSRDPASAKHIIPAFGWLLTIAVALIGTTPTPFAFHTHPEDEAQADKPSSERRPVDATKNLSLRQVTNQTDFAVSEPEVFDAGARLAGAQRDYHSNLAKLQQAKSKYKKAQFNQLSIMRVHKL